VPISFAWTSSQSGFFDLASIPSLGQSSIWPEGNAGIRTPHGSLCRQNFMGKNLDKISLFRQNLFEMKIKG
jgi:hypothetical protein